MCVCAHACTHIHLFLSQVLCWGAIKKQATSTAIFALNKKERELTHFITTKSFPWASKLHVIIETWKYICFMCACFIFNQNEMFTVSNDNTVPKCWMWEDLLNYQKRIESVRLWKPFQINRLSFLLFFKWTLKLYKKTFTLTNFL